MILGLSRLILEKTGLFGNFFLEGGGGSPIPKCICQNTDKKVNIFVKTKNAPEGLKRKINPQIYFWTEASQIGGVGGGGRHLGKSPKKSRIFFLTGSLTVLKRSILLPTSHGILKLSANVSICSWGHI